MRNSFELLDWLKANIGSTGVGSHGVALADEITPGIVKLTHDVSHEEANHTAVAPDGVAAYAESRFIPKQFKAVHHEAVTNETTSGTASCEECASAIILNLNLKITAQNGAIAASFPLDATERVSDARIRVRIGNAEYELYKNGLNLVMGATSQLTDQVCNGTITVPYF